MATFRLRDVLQHRRREKNQKRRLSSAIELTLRERVIALMMNQPGPMYSYSSGYVNPQTWRTNLVTWSESLASAAWANNTAGTGVNPVTTDNAGLDANGAMTAARLQLDAGAGLTINDRSLKVGPSALTKPGQSYTHAIDLKSYSGATYTVRLTYIDGTFENVTVTGTWQRFVATRTAITASSIVARISVHGEGVTSRTADILVSRVQLNVGSTELPYQKITDFNTEYRAANPKNTLYADLSGSPAVPNGAVAMTLDVKYGLDSGVDERTKGVLVLTGTATAATFDTSSGVGSAARVDGSNQSTVQVPGLLPNTIYCLDFSAVSGSMVLRTGAVSGTIFLTLNAPGMGYVLSDSSGRITIAVNGNGASVTFTLASIRPIPGVHAYQLTSASRPILRGAPTGSALLDDDFISNLGWTLVSGWDISGGVLSKGVTSGGSVADHSFPEVNGRWYRVEMDVSSITPGAGNLSVRLSGGTQVLSPSFTTPGVKVFWLLGNGTNNTIRIAGSTADCVFSINYIRINDVSADVVTEPFVLQYDGFDDGLVTAPIDASAYDEVFTCAGLRKHSDAAGAMAVEFGPIVVSTTNTFGLFAPGAGGIQNIAFGSRGSGSQSLASYTNAAAAAGVKLLATAHAKISTDLCVLSQDGAQVVSSGSDQGSGNYGTYPLNFGCRNQASARYNGSMSTPVVAFGPFTDAQRALIQSYAAEEGGFTL